MNAAERISGDITEGAVFLKRGDGLPKPAKVTKSLEDALAEVQLEWIEE